MNKKYDTTRLSSLACEGGIAVSNLYCWNVFNYTCTLDYIDMLLQFDNFIKKSEFNKTFARSNLDYFQGQGPTTVFLGECLSKKYYKTDANWQKRGIVSWILYLELEKVYLCRQLCESYVFCKPLIHWSEPCERQHRNNRKTAEKWGRQGRYDYSKICIA